MGLLRGMISESPLCAVKHTHTHTHTQTNMHTLYFEATKVT